MPTSVDYSVIPSFNWFITDFMFTCARAGVPIFLMLSGALSLGRDWKLKDFLKKRLPRITLPFLFWLCVLSTIVILSLYYFDLPKFACISDFTFGGIANFIMESSTGGNQWFVPYWFFWMILGTYLIMPIFNNWVRLASMEEVEYFLAIWLITCLFDYTLFVKFPIKLSYFASPIGLVVLGYYLRHTKRKIFNSISWGLAILIVSSVVLMGFSYMLSTPSEFFKFHRYAIIIVFEVVGIFCVFKNFGQLNINWGFLSDENSLFRRLVFSIAKYSYGIYLIHQVIMNFLIIFFVKLLPFKVMVLFLFVMTLALSMGILAILNRVPYLNQCIGSK